MSMKEGKYDTPAAYQNGNSEDSPTSNNTTTGEKRIRKEDPQNAGNATESSEDKAIYEYLTFRTDLPLPPILGPRPEVEDETTLLDANHLPKNFPTAPDLTPYQDPMAWSQSRKRFMTWLSRCVTITAAWAAGAYIEPADELTKAWGISHVAYNTGITIFTCGFAVAPMILARFSEINGRRPVFITTGIVFVIGQIGCAVTESFSGMLISRFITGVGGSTFSTMVGGILADIWANHERNTPMTIFTGATMLGTGLGPLVSGFLAQNTSWRWVFYLQAILAATLIALITAFFRETRGSILLSRKAAVLNKWYSAMGIVQLFSCIFVSCTSVRLL